MFGDSLRRIVAEKDRSVTIELLPGDYDCDNGSFIVKISDGEFQGEGTSCNLLDAVQMARNRLVNSRKEVTPVVVKTAEAVIAPSRPKLSASGLKINKK